MTTVVRPPNDSDGKRRPHAADDALADDPHGGEHDSEWVVDMASNRVIRRDVPPPRTKS